MLGKASLKGKKKNECSFLAGIHLAAANFVTRWEVEWDYVKLYKYVIKYLFH